jgi:hypothetical protein
MSASDVQLVLLVWMCGLLVWGGVVGAALVRRRVIMARAAQDVLRLQAAVDAWEREHRAKVRQLDEHLQEAERSKATAERGAQIAIEHLRDLHYDLCHRLDAVEGQVEIDRLVAQGRIAPEHSPLRVSFRLR